MYYEYKLCMSVCMYLNNVFVLWEKSIEILPRHYPNIFFQDSNDVIENTPSPRPITRNIGRPISKTVLSTDESDSEIEENNMNNLTNEKLIPMTEMYKK